MPSTYSMKPVIHLSEPQFPCVLSDSGNYLWWRLSFLSRFSMPGMFWVHTWLTLFLTIILWSPRRYCSASNFQMRKLTETLPGSHRSRVRLWLRQSDSLLLTTISVGLSLEHALASPGGCVKTQVVEPHPRAFWFSRPGVETKNVHFSQVDRWYCCCWSRDHTWEPLQDTNLASWNEWQ